MQQPGALVGVGRPKNRLYSFRSSRRVDHTLCESSLLDVLDLQPMLTSSFSAGDSRSAGAQDRTIWASSRVLVSQLQRIDHGRSRGQWAGAMLVIVEY